MRAGGKVGGREGLGGRRYGEERAGEKGGKTWDGQGTEWSKKLRETGGNEGKRGR